MYRKRRRKVQTNKHFYLVTVYVQQRFVVTSTSEASLRQKNLFVQSLVYDILFVPGVYDIRTIRVRNCTVCLIPLKNIAPGTNTQRKPTNG